MKSIFWIFPFLFLQFMSASAQVSVGLKGGGNINNIVIQDASDLTIGWRYKSKTSFHAGIFSKIDLSTKIALLSELQFIKKGSEFGNGNDLAKVDIRVNYLELPVLVSYSPVKWVAFELGPSFALNLKGGSTLKAMPTYNPDNKTYDGRSLRKFESGITGGLRFYATSKISFAGRYYRGLSSIGDVFFTEDGRVGIAKKTYNSNIQFAVYYTLKKFK